MLLLDVKRSYDRRSIPKWFVGWQTLRERLLAIISLFFAIIALALAVIRIFGLLSYAVSRQHREIGIRLALGARPAHVVRRVTSGLLPMMSLGLFVGLALALPVDTSSRVFCSRSRPHDPGAVVGLLIILLGVAVLAALPPAIRAVRVDPAQTLRRE